MKNLGSSKREMLRGAQNDKNSLLMAHWNYGIFGCGCLSHGFGLPRTMPGWPGSGPHAWPPGSHPGGVDHGGLDYRQGRMQAAEDD